MSACVCRSNVCCLPDDFEYRSDQPAEPAICQVAVEFSAETAFDASYVVLFWTIPAVADEGSYYQITRNGTLLATVQDAEITNAYTAGAIVPGEDYTYEVTLFYGCVEEDQVVPVWGFGQDALGDPYGSAIGTPST
jgi:hypothetical protein